MWTLPSDPKQHQIQRYDLLAKEIPVPKAQTAPVDDDALATQAGSRLAAVRKARNVTQVQLAERLGITQSMLSKYERGDLRLHGAMLTRIAEILSVSTDELLGVKVSPPPPIPVLKDKRLRRRIHQIDKLSKRDREALIRTIDAFLRAAHDDEEPRRKAG
jgi:transcriptional regulator with XRE-family HTH domain